MTYFRFVYISFPAFVYTSKDFKNVSVVQEKIILLTLNITDHFSKLINMLFN